ncbi:MAG: hypothetical protein HY744_32850 [Deltaproteobacteria bacterium]|nr:hypothetical protein [Deltaproteobacteria bacterium]
MAFAWARIKSDPGTILGALIVAGLLSNVVSGVGSGIRSADRDSLVLGLVNAGLSLVNFLVMTFMEGGMTLFALKVARGQPYELGDIFKGGPYFAPLLVANILTGLAVAFGLLLLIVPGIILALGLSLTVPIVVDRNLHAVDAMKESWRLTTGHKVGIFVFGLLMAALMLLGLLACCVGVLVVAPLGQIAWVFLPATERPADGARGIGSGPGPQIPQSTSSSNSSPRPYCSSGGAPATPSRMS